MSPDEIVAPAERLLPLPGTGEVVDLDQPEQVGQAIADMRDMRTELQAAIGVLSAAAHEVMDRQLEWTLHLPGLKVAGKPPRQTTYDVDQLRATLADCVERGLLTEEAAGQAIRAKVTYEPAKRGIAKLCALGGEVEERVRACARPDDRPRYVTVSRVGS